MTTQEKIKAAQKRIKELAILIALWKQEDKIKKEQMSERLLT